MQLKLVGVKPENWASMAVAAAKFNVDYPDRLGSYHGVVYGYLGKSWYIYRTKTQIVVREL